MPFLEAALYFPSQAVLKSDPTYYLDTIKYGVEQTLMKTSIMF